MAGTIAISSQKGGIGKTTTAAWGDVGDRVLLVDLDPQFALTRRFGLNAAEVPGTVYDLLVGDERLADSLALVHPRVELLAARRELARLELTLAGEHHRERFLAELLNGEAGDYDTVVIDCPRASDC